tara:strand:- start:763 stop:1485 length:723 start_codon:yes stop_codon:yes gene_type:complete
MSEKIVMGKDNIKRLQKDIIDIIRNPLTDNGIYYSHDDTNMLKGYAVIFGPDDSIYRYGAYIFEFKFPTNYPYSPPKLIYMTNDGITRFHPNLYRNGKVCISILNTWKGEQWTSCQTIRSILLMLVTLLHNKPLLNEPGIKETHSSFKPYNKIITYKNLEIAILRNVTNKSKYNDIIQGLLIYHKKYIQENKDKIMEYINSLKKKFKNGAVEEKTSIYGMKVVIDYQKLYDDFLNYFNNN